MTGRDAAMARATRRTESHATRGDDRLTYTTGGKSAWVLGHDGSTEDGQSADDGGDELHFDGLVVGREVTRVDSTLVVDAWQ